MTGQRWEPMEAAIRFFNLVRPPSPPPWLPEHPPVRSQFTPDESEPQPPMTDDDAWVEP